MFLLIFLKLVNFVKNQNRIKTASKLHQNCVKTASYFLTFFLEVSISCSYVSYFFAKCHDFLLIQNVIQQLGDKKNMNSDNILMSLVDMAKEMILLK